MIPDVGFTKQLKALDKNLDVVWDWGSEKWEIWHFPDDGKRPYMVTRVQTKNKSYRELGQDVLINLQMNMQLGAKEIINYLEEHEYQMQRRKAKDFSDKIREIAKDAWTPLFGLFSQVPKCFMLEKKSSQKIAEVVR